MTRRCKPSIMQTKFKKFLQAGVVIPVLTTHLAVSSVSGGITGLPSVADILSVQNRTPSAEEIANKQLIDTGAKKIEKYFSKYDLPMKDYSYALAETAFRKNLPISTLAAMAMIESTGMAVHEDGRPKTCAQRTNNPFGYGSCKIKFDSVESAIETVGATLNAENPGTASFYEGKTLPEKLRTYNGPGHVADKSYVKKVMWVMDQIDSMDPNTDLATVNSKNNS